MRLKRFILLLFSVFCGFSLFAQSQGELTQSRILILLDESSSMVKPWAGGMEKFRAADSIILRLMDSVYAVNPDVEFSLRVFGHQHTVEEDNCQDTKNEVPFSKDNRTQMAFRLADIRPLGVTPIAYALEQAAAYDLADEAHNAYSIILITDGGESCGGDICDVMKKLIEKKVYFKPYIVSLEDYAPLRSTYSCMGDYLQVTRKNDISPAVSKIVAAFRPALRITKAEYKQLQTIAANVPSSLKMNIPVKMTEPAPKPAALDTQLVVPVKTFADNTTPKPVVITKPAVSATPVTPAHPSRKIAHLETVPLKTFNIATVNTPGNAKTVNLPLSLPPVISETAVHQIASLEQVPLKHIGAPPANAPQKAKTADIPLSLPPVASEAAVHKIASLSPSGLKTFNLVAAGVPVKAIIVAAPSTLPPIVTDEVIASRKVDKLTPALLKPQAISQPAAEKAPIMAIPMPLPLVPDEVVAIPRKITRMTPSPLRSFNVYAATTPKKPGLVTLPFSLPGIIADSVVAPQKIARLKSPRLKTFNVLFVVEDRIFVQRTIPGLPHINYDNLVPRIDSKIPIPLKQPVPPGKKGNFTVETENAKETSLEIYFTDGMGKFYPATPQMIVVDPRTKKILKKFFRTIDANGNPDPQTDIPEGTYDIAVAGSRSLIMHDVDIVKDKKNKVVIKIKKCSLKFAYINAPGRPVKEFSAVVTERDKANGKVVQQKCTEELLYEPGNYHIDINTFPADVRNVDLELDDETIISIAQPGFAKFTAEGKTQVVALYAKRGEHFLNFYSLNLTDPASQHLQIQPGEYQAHYQKGSGNGAEKVIPFIVKSTEETEVILK